MAERTSIRTKHEIQLNDALERLDITKIRQCIKNGEVDVRAGKELEVYRVCICTNSVEGEEKRLQIINVLIQHGFNVNDTYHFCERTPLHIAASYGYASIAEALIEAGALVDKYGHAYTPLHLAVSADSKDCVDVLLKHSADINAKTRITAGWLETPMSLAIARRKGHMAVYLHQRGARLHHGQVGTIPTEDIESTRLCTNMPPGFSDQLACTSPLWLEPSHGDIVFHVEGKQLFTKKKHLSEISSFFRKKFDEANSQSVTFGVNLTYNSIQAMLEYMYTGDIKNADRNVLLNIFSDTILLGMPELCTFVQKKKLIPVFNKAHLKHSTQLGNPPDFKNFIMVILNEGLKQKSRYLVHFCTSTLLESLDEVLDQPKFQSLSFEERLEYVNMLLTNVDEISKVPKFKQIPPHIAQAILPESCIQGNIPRDTMNELGLPKKNKTSDQSSVLAYVKDVVSWMWSVETTPKSDKDDYLAQVVYTHTSSENGERTFPVKRVNWYYRYQDRILDVGPDGIKRRDPTTNDIKASHTYQVISQIVLGVDFVQFRFKDGSMTEYYVCDDPNSIVETIQQHNIKKLLVKLVDKPKPM